MKNKTIIISAFPATGKTYFYQTVNLKVSDSDSSQFSWLPNKQRNPKFPQNYIDHIKKLIGNVDIILVSSHKTVRDALVKEGLKFTLVYPDRKLRVQYLIRCAVRGSDEGFITMLDKMWDSFIDEMEAQEKCDHIVLKNGEYLTERFRGSINLS